jgi:hypothetical protein
MPSTEIRDGSNSEEKMEPMGLRHSGDAIIDIDSRTATHVNEERRYSI